MEEYSDRRTSMNKGNRNMRPAERILRYPNLASYLEENLPTNKIVLLQCPWQNIEN
jgi:hypothetical protein